MSIGRKIAVNFGWLLGGRGSAAVITLAATVLTARALGADAFGIVVLIHTAALVIRQLCRVKTAEAVIRFGVPARERGDEDRWRHLLAATLRLDILTALAAAGLAAVLIAFAGGLFGLEPGPREAAWLYVLGLASSGTGTAKGTLRVFDHYRLLGGLLTLGPMVRLAGVVYAGYAGAPVQDYVLIWAGALLVEELSVLVVGWRLLRPGPIIRIPHGFERAFAGEPLLKRFLVVVYWQSNLDVFPRHVVTLLVGAWFGTAGAGVFRLARDVAEILGKPVVLLRQAIFPDLSRLWQQDARAFGQLTARVSRAMLLLGSGFVVAALFIGEPLLGALAGPEYRAGAAVMALLLAAATLDLGGAALRPASYTLGRETAVLKIQALALLAYVPIIFALAGPLGLQAAGWATLAAAAVNFGGLTVLVRRAVRAAVEPSGQ